MLQELKGARVSDDQPFSIFFNVSKQFETFSVLDPIV